MTEGKVINPQKEQKKEKKGYTNINYSELQALVDKKQNNRQKMLPGLQMKKKQFHFSSATHKLSTKNQTKNMPVQSKLLRTAVQSIQKKNHEDLLSQEVLSQRLGNSFMLQSRNITPNNPMLNSKRRQNTHVTQKSKLHSQLYDIQSQQEDEHRQPKFKHKDFVLYDHLAGQSEVAFKYAFGKERKINNKIIASWKQCLFHQDKAQIYLKVNPQENINIPYTHPKIFAINQLQKGFDQIYGIGKNRCLKIGQESSIIEAIQRYLKKCQQEPMKIARRDFDIITDILADCKLQELQGNPNCYKQIEAHLKIMATRWKFMQSKKKIDRVLQLALVGGRNNFVDLSKSGILAEYLLMHSNAAQI